MSNLHRHMSKKRFGQGWASGSGKAFLLVLLATLTSLPGLAQSDTSSGWSFSTGAGLELRYGVAHEYVYDQGRILSQLDWDIKPVAAISSVARLKKGASIFALSCAAGFPGASGIITDSDWQNEGTSFTNWKTNYSESNAVTERLIDLTISYGYNFKLSGSFELTTFVGFRSLGIEWSAHDGWLQYSAEQETAPPQTVPPFTSYTTGAKYSLYGLLSTYSQSYSAFLVGTSATWQMSESLALTFGLEGAPVVSCTAVDNHILRGLTFTDNLSGGFLIEPQLGLHWSPVGSLALGLDLRYTLISGLHGDETVVAGSNVGSSEGLSPGQSATYLDAGGAGLSAFALALSAEIRL